MRSKKALLNIILSLVLQLVTVICGFIVPRLIIRNFGSNVNGLVTSITQFLAYITLLDSGFTSVVMAILYKPIAYNEKEKVEMILKSAQSFFRRIAYIFIGYIIVLCIVLPLIVSAEFDKIYSLLLIIIISLSTFSEFYFGMTYRIYIQAKQELYVIAIIRIVTLILNTILILILINIGANIHIVKLCSTFVFIFRPILQNLYVKKKYDINLKNTPKGYKIEQKWDGLAQHIAAVIHNNTDVVILTLFSNSLEVSVYSIYALVVSGIRSIVQSFAGGIEATFGDMIAKGENENLNKKFRIYEEIYFTISAILCISTLFLIIPFVKTYTHGITDANYIRPFFGYLIVIAEFFWIIRLPYSSITRAAGHFRETQIGAWVEARS